MTIQQSFLEANHLSNKEDVDCSDKCNIVIGPNGGGKSRFLRAVMSQYEALGYAEHEIVFANFPMLTYKGENQKPSESYPAHGFFFANSRTSLKDLMLNINLEQNDLVETLLTGRPRVNEKTIWPKLFPSLLKFLDGVLSFQLKKDDQLITVKGEDKSYNDFIEFLNTQASPGERNLFYMCIFLAALATHRKDDSKLVILLDEPESHMHPSKVARFVELVEEELPNASLWVATHSVNLLPKFEFEEIVYVKDSKVQKRSSRMYRDIYSSLVGTSEDVETFLRGLIEWETCSFVAECLALPPTTVNKTRDKQSNLIKRLVQEQISDKKELRVLDYGAGEGRIGVMLNDWESEKLKYYTFETDTNKNAEYYKQKIQKHYQGHITPRVPVRSGFFDLILLVNTLHEIPPTEWAFTLQSIFRLLNPSGHLIFCESNTFNHGEYLGNDKKTGKPYGFLVLDEPSARILFNNPIAQKIETIFTDEKITCVVVKKLLGPLRNASLGLFSKDLISQTLKILGESSLEKYISLLQKKKKANELDFASGRKAAFYLTQYANAQIGLELLEGSPSARQKPENAV
jgi:SAM-dependent methyltransferase/ABC-type hemin transport system ATPase subunit